MKKFQIFIVIIMILLVGNVISQTTESIILGIGQNLALNVISSANPAVGRLVGFAISPQAAAIGEVKGLISRNTEVGANLIDALDKAEAATDPQKALNEIQGEIFTQVTKSLAEEGKIEEARALQNVQQTLPYLQQLLEVQGDTLEGGRAEIDNQGNVLFKDKKGNEQGDIPKGWEITQTKTKDGRDSIQIKNIDSKEEINLGNIKFKGDKDSSLVVSQEKDREGNIIHILETDNADSLTIEKNSYNDIKNGKFKLNQDGKIEFAEFDAAKKTQYVFLHKNKEYRFDAEKGSHVLFNPTEKVIEAKNGKIILDKQEISGDSSIIRLDENGNVNEISLSDNGIYFDKISGKKLSSEEEFKVFLDGRDILSEKNAVSVLTELDKSQLNIKGKIKVTNGIKYEGLSEEVFTRYRTWDNVFDVNFGDALIDNGKHKVILQEGKTLLDTKIGSNNNPESFTFRYTHDDTKDVFYAQIDETSGNLNQFAFIDGKETKVISYPLDDYEQRINELSSRSGLDAETDLRDKIDELNRNIVAGKERGEAVSDLIKDRDALAYVLVNNDVQKAINDKDYSLARSKLKNFIKEVNDPEIKANVKLSLGELYVAESKLDNDEIARKLIDSHLREGNAIKYFNINGIGVDGDNIQLIKEASRFSDTFTSGEIIGEEDNFVIVKSILGDEYKIKKEVALSERFGFDRDEQIRQWRKFNKEEAVKIYNSIIEDNFVREGSLYDDSQASLALGQLALEEGNLDTASWAYNRIRGNENLDPKTRAAAELGFAMTNLERSSDPDKSFLLEDSLKNVAQALKYDPNNRDILQFRNNLQESILKVVSKGLSEESSELSNVLLEKVGDSGFFTTSIFDSAIYAGDDLRIIYEDKQYILDQQQQGILALRKILDKGYSLQDYVNLDVSGRKELLADVLGLDKKHRAVDNFFFGTSEVLRNPDVANLINHGQNGEFKFKTGEGYINKEGLESTWKDTVLKGFNIKNVALFAGPAATVKGVSLVGWAGKGLGVSGARTLGSFKILEKAYNIAPKTTRTLGFLGAEAAETGAGFISEAFVPGSGFYVEALTGHAGVFDVVERAAARATRSGLNIAKPQIGRIFVTKDNEVIQALSFSSREHMTNFLANVENIKRLDEDLFEVDGRKFVGLIENEIHTTIPIGVLREGGISTLDVTRSIELDDIHDNLKNMMENFHAATPSTITSALTGDAEDIENLIRNSFNAGWLDRLSERLKTVKYKTEDTFQSGISPEDAERAIQRGEILYHQTILDTEIGRKVGVHHSATHSYGDTVKQSKLISVVAITEQEVVNIDRMTRLSHWLDDFTDPLKPPVTYEAMYESRQEFNDLVKSLGEPNVAVSEMVSLSGSEQGRKGIQRGIHRMIYGSLIQNAPDAGIQKKLMDEFLEISVEDLDPNFAMEIRDTIRPMVFAQTNKVVFDNMMAIEPDYDPDLSRALDMWYAPSLYYHDIGPERIAGETIFHVEPPTEEEFVEMIDLAEKWLKVLPDHRRNLRLKQMETSIRVFEEVLPKSVFKKYKESIESLTGKRPPKLIMVTE